MSRLRGEVRGLALTPHEWDAMRLVALLGRKEAATKLGIALGTIQHLIASVYAKLGVTTQAEFLVAVGWLAIPSEGATIVHHAEVARAKVRADTEALLARVEDIAAGLSDVLAE